VHVAPSAPTINLCPSDMIASATSSSCTTVSWTSPSGEDKDGLSMSVPSPSTSPTGGLVSGSSFCFGVTRVSYNFTDSVSGLWTECAFDVNVTGMVFGYASVLSETCAVVC